MSLSTEAGLRRALLGVAALTCLGLSAELLLAEHVEPGPQLIPFVLCALSLIGVAALWRSPSAGSVKALRGLAALVALGGAFGSFEHMEHNLEFQEEIRPSAPAAEKAKEALMGANPLLAPGAFIAVALLMAAATWRHPAGGSS